MHSSAKDEHNVRHLDSLTMMMPDALDAAIERLPLAIVPAGAGYAASQQAGKGLEGPPGGSTCS